MNYSTTYSPEDNKLRLYASSRLDAETYAKVKAAGFRWAPAQELFFAIWSPSAEDLLVSLAGEIEDEDKSLVERAEERAERFEGYSERRMKEAEAARATVDQIAQRFEGGQPILVGHHSEKSARKDQERIQNGMRKAVSLWKTSSYWTDRAAGAVAAAKYKEQPAVRARRIKTIESALRKAEKEQAKNEKLIKAWRLCAGINEPEKQRVTGLHIANFSGYWSMSFPLKDFPRDPPASQYEGPMGLWSAIDGGVITAAQAAAIAIPALERGLPGRARWIEHYQNRLAYERAMLAEQGGTEADKVKPEIGGAVRCWAAPGFGKGWAYIVKVNKVTVAIRCQADHGGRIYGGKMPFDKLVAVMSRADVEKAKAEGRLMEVAGGTGFYLTDAPAPEPKPPTPESETDQAFRNLEQAAKAGVRVVVVPQLFETPRDVAERAAELLDIQPGDAVLEPSAGTGRLLGAMGGRMFGHNPERGSITAVEINPVLASTLRGLYPLTKVVTGDFLATEVPAADKILMNPPFENGSDIKHIQKAFEVLAPGGRIVAICAAGPRQRERIGNMASFWEDLPAGTFKEAGTMVNTALVVIDKPMTS